MRAAVTLWVERGWVAESVIPTRQIAKAAPAPPCPLTPAEVERIRLAGQHSSVDTLLPVLVELALAGLNLAEIAALGVSAVNTDSGLVYVGSTGDGEWKRAVGLPTDAITKVGRHVAALQRQHAKAGAEFNPEVVPLGLHPSPRSVRDRVRPTVVGQHLYRALKLAGIARAGVTPGSLRDYGANAVYARTNRIEDVAATLGIISLDAAMRLIDSNWQTAWAPTVREQTV